MGSDVADSKNIKFSVQSNLSELLPVRNKIRNFIGNALDDISMNRTILSVDEALANVIIHGYGDTAGLICIELNETDESFIITLTDHAPPFNPLSVNSPDYEAYHNSGDSNGLGVDVYRRLMKTSYSRTGDEHNRLELIMEKNK